MKNLIKQLLVFSLAFVIVQKVISPKKVDIIKDVAPHVVPWRLLVKNNERYATGFHFKYKGKVYIMTNKHVCDGNLNVYGHGHIQFGNYIGEIIKISVDHDLCLVTSNREDGLELADKDIKPLDPVTVVGFPRGLGKTIRTGHFVEEEYIEAPWINPIMYILFQKKYRAYRVSTLAYGGNSGSPIINEKGKVVGVLFAGPVYIHTEALIVPYDDMMLFIEETLGQ